MKYYVLRHSHEEKVVGVTPQSEGMKSGYIHNAADSIFKMEPYKVPNFEPNFNSILLSKKANLTDWLDDPFGSTGPGITISQKFATILSLYNLCKNRFYKVNIIHKGSLVGNYSYLRIGEILEDIDCIDFSKTHFISKPMFSWMEDEPIILNVKNKSELQQVVKEQIESNPMFKVVPDSALYVNTKFNKNMDLFYFGFSNMYIISARLKSKIEESNITAVEFKELSTFGFEIISNLTS